MGHIHNIVDSDKHFTINSVNRKEVAFSFTSDSYINNIGKIAESSGYAYSSPIAA